MTDLCRCGRSLRLLNAASDDPKCVGCGRLDEECVCVESPPVRIIEAPEHVEVVG